MRRDETGGCDETTQPRPAPGRSQSLAPRIPEIPTGLARRLDCLVQFLHQAVRRQVLPGILAPVESGLRLLLVLLLLPPTAQPSAASGSRDADVRDLWFPAPRAAGVGFDPADPSRRRDHRLP